MFRGPAAFSNENGQGLARGFQHVKAPGNPGHHEADPRRENGIGIRPARLGIDSSLIPCQQVITDGRILPVPRCVFHARRPKIIARASCCHWTTDKSWYHGKTRVHKCKVRSLRGAHIMRLPRELRDSISPFRQYRHKPLDTMLGIDRPEPIPPARQAYRHITPGARQRL